VSTPGARLFARLVDTRSALLVIVATAVWLAATAGVRPLMLPDEGRYVGIAWEMLTSGDWLVPRLDGLPFFHKPPLFYWLTSLSLGLFGSHQLAARVASLLAATLAAGGMYLFARRYRGSQVATIAVVVLLTQPIFYAAAQFANLDMLVAGLISLAILSGADALLRLEKGNPYHAALARAYGFTALGILAKGLIGIVLPAGVLLLWLLWRRSWRFLPTMLWPSGCLLLLLIALPWFFWMQHLYPGFFDYFVVYHHFQRFSETGFNNQVAFWFYIPVILLCALPWSPWFARVFIKPCWTDKDASGLRSLMAIWLGVIVASSSLCPVQNWSAISCRRFRRLPT
jgi:4-amino-4-deoxy-L-arabinose transferase-like glycosyltransferase